MSKYLCLCGAQFDHQKGADLHIEYNEEHTMLKQNWRGRAFDCLMDFTSAKLLRCVGFIGVHGIFIHHFHYNWWESGISALCIGLII